MSKIEVDETQLTKLETNALALQTIANRVLADVAEIKRLKAASANRPNKPRKGKAYYEAKVLANILGTNYNYTAHKK